MTRSLEQILLYHCAPALAGIKPSCLVSFSRARHSDIERRIQALDAVLSTRGIRLTTICCCARYCMVFAYRESCLSGHLQRPEISGYLHTLGYPANMGAQQALEHFEKRLTQQAGFPHELGVLLGYPLEDVRGFIKHKGQNCKLSGYWKVYANEAQTAALFKKYTRCREILCRHASTGLSIAALFRAA